MFVYIFGTVMLALVSFSIYQMWPTKTEERKCRHNKQKPIGVIHSKLLQDVFWCPVCGSLGLRKLGESTTWFSREKE